jgi:uncharacterized LabA/DUF88 family protein
MNALRNSSDMRIALFIDVENLVRAANTIGLPADIAPVLQKLKEYGLVQVRRSFGDLERNVDHPRDRNLIRRMLHKNLVLIEDIPYITRSKNTADIRLAVEAMSVAYQYSDINCFAIVASDRDYVPLFNKLRELGRTIIGIGIDRENINSNYREACDILIYYETLFNNTQFVTPESEASLAQLQESYYNLLRQAVHTLEQKGKKPLGTAVAGLMRQLRSDFDPSLIGCDSFKRFIQRAEEDTLVLVEWPTGAGDYLIALNADAEAPPVRVAEYDGHDPNEPMDPQESADYYRRILESKIRVALPGVDTRRSILSALATTYEDLTQEGPLNLRDWSEQTYGTHFYPSDTLEQANVFKIVLALYFARCFKCQQTLEQFNPIILAMACDFSAWEERLHSQFIRTIHYEDDTLTLDPEGVSLFLYEDLDHVEEAEKLIEEVVNS